MRLICWRKLRDEQAGLTLLELLAVALIVMLLVLMALPVYAEVTDRARQAKSGDDLRVIEQALERHKADRGFYPDRLGALIDLGYLKKNMQFLSAWGDKDTYLFYAVDSHSRAMSFALGDPGPKASSGCSVDAKSATLHRGIESPLPCGRDPLKQAAWRITELSLDCKLPFVQMGPWQVQSFRGYRTAGPAISQGNGECSPAADASGDLRTES